jgi:hypothetical protein
MKIDKYLAFSTADSAKEFLGRLHAAMQHRETWAEPNVHPFENRALVPWHDGYLAQHSNLIEGVEQLSLEQARDQGFIFGRLKGPFAPRSSKTGGGAVAPRGLGWRNASAKFSCLPGSVLWVLERHVRLERGA